MTFRVGQRVVCVNAAQRDFDRRDQASDYIKLGALYEIRWVGAFPYDPDNLQDFGVRLVGIVRPADDHYPEFDDYPFGAGRFRPVVEKKTDISVFTALLNTKQRENVLCGND